ncbi:MAG TPA: lysylphosphatidylglycerol synthase domain-containing protein [Gaiellales bacterium]|nr:lysylphosphatidylglycerol synthase domain-containing protein [Gaiellales bacterium]
MAGEMRSISLPILVVALALHTCEMLLNALAWRNILRRAYPRSDVSYRVVLGGYGGGVALNSLLPAQAGTVAMLGIYRARIQASTALGLVGAGVVQNAFYVVIGVAVCIALIATQQGALDPQLGSLYAHAVLVVVGVIVLGILAWVLVRRCQALAGAKDGVAILLEPRVYAAQVLAVELAAYVVRAVVTGLFMSAYGLPVSPQSVLIVLAVNSISSTLAFTPGGVGTQQALASAALRNVAPSSAIAAFSLGQQLILAAWDIVFGALALASIFGWSATRTFARRGRMAPSAS